MEPPNQYQFGVIDGWPGTYWLKEISQEGYIHFSGRKGDSYSSLRASSQKIWDKSMTQWKQHIGPELQKIQEEIGSQKTQGKIEELQKKKTKMLTEFYETYKRPMAMNRARLWVLALTMKV